MLVLGEGRAVGNLGNAYTAIGQYEEAVKYHKRRLQIAEEADDLVRLQLKERKKKEKKKKKKKKKRR